MIALKAVLLLGIAYPFYSFWRSKRQVAWNVVNAALVLQGASPDLLKELDSEVKALLPVHRLNPKSFAGLAPEVRLALYSIAMQRRGIQPEGSGEQLRSLSSPFLARSAKTQIQMVRYQVESNRKVRLTELDGLSTSS